MAVRPTSLALENLESRLNLSTLAGHSFVRAAGRGSFVQDRAVWKGYGRLISLPSSGAALSGAANTSAASQALVAAVGADSPAPNVMAVPTDRSITLSWQNNSTNETGFRIERSLDGQTFSTLAKVGAAQTTYTDAHTVLGKTYTYRVTAFNLSQDTAASSPISSAMLPPPPPAAPDQMGVARVTTNSVALTWKDIANNESGYRVYRSADGTDFTLVGTLRAGSHSFVDKKLDADTSYTYEVCAWNPGGDNDGTIAAQTLLPPPTAPAHVTFSNVTSSSVNLSWTESSSFVDGFRIYRTSGGGVWTMVGNVDSDTTSFTDTSVAPKTHYSYQVSAWNAVADKKSKSVAVSTPVAPPNAPMNLAFSDITTSGVALSWTDASTGETGFRVYRSTDGATYTLAGAVGANVTTYSDSNLNPGTVYWYKVAAYSSAGEQATDGQSVLTAVVENVAGVVAPDAPASVTFSNITTSSVTLNWTDPADNIGGIRIYRSTNGTDFTMVQSLGATATSWTDSGLQDSTAYYYEVAAWNLGGETTSDVATVSTLVMAPDSPTGLMITNVGSNGMTLNWTAPSTGGAVSGYNIYRSADGNQFTLVDSTTGTTWTDSGLSATTTYYYEVGAFNTTGEAKSSSASATTTVQMSTDPVTISTANMTSFQELVIIGTSGADSIFVSQSSDALTIFANGQTYTEPTTFGDIKIYGGDGNDVLTVDSSVNIATLVYGGDGNNTIKNQTTAKATIVTIGDGVSAVTGNGVNTAYWVNVGDTVNATTAEKNLGGVNRVANFYQPFSSNPASSMYVPRSLDGQNLQDPTDSGAERRLTNSSFWGAGPTMNDINQTGLSDCYYLAPLASLAYSEPQKLMNMGVDLGDGTYAVRFVRGGTTTYVRVDGDLSIGYWDYGLKNQTPGANGDQWGSIFEKAYAFFRNSQNSYASLNWGSQATTYYDLGLTSTSLSPMYSTDVNVMSTINTQIAANHGVVASTNGTIKPGAPLIESHVYTIIGAYKNSSGTVMIQLRNPWGVDGAGNDANPNDGLVTISFATFAANFNSLNYTTA